MIWKKILIGGAGLSVGASVVDKLPANAASAGVKSGLGSVGPFLPLVGTLGGATMATDQLNKLRKKK